VKRFLAPLLVFALLVAAWGFLVGSASPEIRNVDPVGASISGDGTTMHVLVPHAGGCAERSHEVHYELNAGTIAMWVEAPVGGFSCLAGCLEEGCTEELTVRLDDPVDPSTPILFRSPGPGLLNGAIALLAGVGIAAAAIMFLWPALTRSGRQRLALDEPHGEDVGAGSED